MPEKARLQVKGNKDPERWDDVGNTGVSVPIGHKYNINNIDTVSATLMYIGYETGDNLWYIRKIDSSSGYAFTHATILNNALVTTYSDAWTNRTILTYGNYSSAF